MLDVLFAKEKILAVVSQIEKLQALEFPYEEPKFTLSILKGLYEKDLHRLDDLDIDTDEEIRREACAHASARVALHYPLLGFILRSTNTLNAFEVYAPLLELCRQVYGSEARLIYSSEWMFSPFTYPATNADIPNCMFIGLPATEAGNSLILPLAGHELGHSVWRKPLTGVAGLLAALRSELTAAYHAHWARFQQVFSTKSPKEDLLADLLLRRPWTQSYRLAARHIEELFCDLIGLRLFGESFIYSFVYLLAPTWGERALNYPSIFARVRAIEAASKRFNIDNKIDVAKLFTETTGQLSESDLFILNMADSASDAMIPKLVEATIAHLPDGLLHLPTSVERDRIIKQFKELSPATKVGSLGDIINAAWAVKLDPAIWNDKKFDPKDRGLIINDLSYKTMEVMEFEQRTR